MAGTTDDRSHGSDSPPFTLPPFVSNLFPFLKPKAPVSVIDVNVPKPKDVSGDDKEPQNSTVSFPYKPPTNEEPLKVEAEPSPGRTSNSFVIWQLESLGN
ncbi:unnamed protein product [Arabis nemorensis]|uniref:Uncharacterized protein n=1 Tax=Arabis nemorensis TaxID=586526 RepID=A0A565BVN8_9BRAS|nr:unnamed protein product [Arabis nemorensis]